MVGGSRAVEQLTRTYNGPQADGVQAEGGGAGSSAGVLQAAVLM